MPDLPVLLKIARKRCVIIGGGSVAVRRATSMVQCGAVVVVIAPEPDSELDALGVAVERRAYHRGDLADAFMVVVATDDPQVNQAVAEEAAAQGVLVNRADDPEAGDLTVPAHGQYGRVTLAVHTGGISAAAAATIRNELAAKIDPDWLTLLDVVAPYRTMIQARFADPASRRDRLIRLTGPDAMNALKQHGADALRQFCDKLASNDKPCTTPLPH